MKKWTGKVMAGTVAAAVLFGGIGGLATAPKAFADDSSTVVPDVSRPLQKRVDVGLNSIVVMSSSIVDMSTDDLNQELRNGKSISDLARLRGIEQSELTDRLVTPMIKRIESALNQKTITDDEAEQLKQEVQDKVSAAVSKAGYQDKMQGVFAKKLKLKTQVDEESVAKVLGISQNELRSYFNDGKTIADIAKEKGLNEDQVIAGLKDELNASLKEFINKK
ncbi:hypothetical protein [Paenibacillus oleatilyticus]|uniref:hypothetical protein n=1 Tax=Paenibacillus oleatilyticus TaxID=2594886 RepID=UPI001C1FAC67|nr:hypothetical protein [Paenibacillus oleatilyticus]MBU7321021.1 hypothetical protein [Paenibacillus oleatilyticus]